MTELIAHSDLANAIRALSMDAVEQAKSGHPGMPMGMADVATVLFSQSLKFDAAQPDWADRDRFVLSAGHGSMLLYSLLHLCGYEDWGIDTLRQFRQLRSNAAGHPEFGHGGGVETTTGPLGQGLATAVGLALGEARDNAQFGDDLVDHRTYVIAGDGCLMEGISHEAISFAGHHKLSKLTVLFDDNAISIDGEVGLTCSDDQMKRFEASGWHCQAIDGHDPQAIVEALRHAETTPLPSMIACRTVIGFGAENKQGTAVAHGAPLGPEEIAAARVKLNWPHAPFEIPEDVAKAWKTIGGKGAAERNAWQTRLETSDESTRSSFAEHTLTDLPEGWESALENHAQSIAVDAPKMATRQASGKALEILTSAIPNLIGGSADLTGSVNTKTSRTLPLTADKLENRFIHYGVREHAMGAIMNGLALHGGTIPYAGTFLVFANYMHASIRLSSLMGLRVIYVLTHDSIGLGEDGPTHQPVETLAMLRATPNLDVFRPADAVETAEAWSHALKRTGGPTAIVLSRQGLPALRESGEIRGYGDRGGYLLRPAKGGKDRDVTLIATGSELSLAVDAQTRLEECGVQAAVVSLPCWELFDRQSNEYRAEVLGVAPRIAIEAAGELGWHKYVGLTGGFVGMKGFGASGPATQLFEHFGITVSTIETAAKSALNQSESVS
ncbi:transketolase [Pelagibius sp. Alg239-R121]|uniref:transketolase n=1 Tax=Pelagibius sp. Alg239-R121 TaxID=2993448 RepID=UPI0024A72C2C|nr:transketolase [Pelagibius sp. Alg239-R121]